MSTTTPIVFWASFVPCASATIELDAIAVGVIAPAAVSVAIAGLDRRASSIKRHTSPVPGIALILVGVAVIAALIGAGLYTLFTD